ncbi:Acg family FMN-binding oxidoreductase [Jannaschia sp. LMIT008]|uniref:Acg family FMN-binding oxidoreductase n=1 Tax=Jannaschia maritima TaxID=3032585 RepID=UPI002810ABD2|nr:twin-arginine translocation pathway signal protein [Jannaschia sp. LMIT008]
MTLSRRSFVALLGGGTIAAAGGGAAAFAVTRTPHAALAPWDMAGGYADPRARALSWALLAPNPHNRQPWTVRMDGDDGMTVWRDPDRDLPVTDPFGRQLTIGMGCFLELARMAAAQEGFATEARLFPDGEGPGDPIAHLRLIDDAAVPDPLFAHVLDRRSHKEPFRSDPVTPQAAASLTPHCRVHLGGPVHAVLLEQANAAHLAEAATPAAWQESIDLLRIGKAEIVADPDGIDVGGPMLEALARLGVLTREAASDPNHPAARGSIEATSDAILSAPATTTIVTATNTRLDQIEAGRLWLRQNLAATGAGLALRPVSQALQEYAEVRPMHDAVHAAAAPDGGTVQMLGLLGHGARTARTPRWPLESRMV